MSKKKRVFTLEFKQRAVGLAREIGSDTEAAKQLGIRPGNIYLWKSRGIAKGSGAAGPLLSANDPASVELRRLQKEIVELRKVNNILKAAAAFFSQDQLK